jgi:hypothetical protein
MALHPELARFQRRLEANGTVVAVHADHLCVRLPLLVSLRVRYDGERLAFDPRFGAMSRTAATVATFGAANAAVVGTLVAGVALPTLVAVCTIGVLATAYEALRYVVTESAVTRVVLLWGTRTEPAAPGAIGSGPATPVRVDAAADPVHAARRTE